MTAGKAIALTRRTFVGKVISLLFNMLSRLVITFFPRSTAAATAKSLQLCPTLCDPIDGSPLGSSVPGILQARLLEWVVISFSKEQVSFKSMAAVIICSDFGAPQNKVSHCSPINLS